MKPYTLPALLNDADDAIIAVVGLLEHIDEQHAITAISNLIQAVTDVRLAWAHKHNTEKENTMEDIINTVRDMLNNGESDDAIMTAIMAHHGGATDLAPRFAWGLDIDCDSDDEEIESLITSMADPCARNAGEAAMMATIDDIEGTYGLTRSYRDAHHNNGEEWRLMRDGEGIALWWDDTQGVETTGWLMSRIVPVDATWGKESYHDIDPCETADQLRALAARVFSTAPRTR